MTGFDPPRLPTTASLLSMRPSGDQPTETHPDVAPLLGSACRAANSFLPDTRQWSLRLRWRNGGEGMEDQK